MPCKPGPLGFASSQGRTTRRNFVDSTAPRQSLAQQSQRPLGMVRVVAVDLGASSGRVFVVEFGHEYFDFAQVHRFWNGGTRAGSHIYWDVLGLHRGILDGIHAAGRSGHLDSIGIDSWGVDYGLLDATGTLLSNPVHYRDDRTHAVVAPVVESVGALDLYRRSGIAVVPFNTIFQLVAGRDPRPVRLWRAPCCLCRICSGTGLPDLSAARKPTRRRPNFSESTDRDGMST